MFFNQNGIKFKNSNNRRKFEEFTNMWKLNNTAGKPTVQRGNYNENEKIL